MNDFLVGYNSVDGEDILSIYKHLMKRHVK